MPDLLATVATAAGAFAVTNIDDFVVLTALFASRGRGGPSRRRIVSGQYLGIAAILAVAGLAAAALVSVPGRWVGLLGLIPIILGVRGLVVAKAAAGQDLDPGSGVPIRGVVGVAAVTIGNGADNISIYVPVLHHGLGTSMLFVDGAVFAALVAVWCAGAQAVAGHRAILVVVRRTGHWLVPAVFVGIGLFIVVRSGLLDG